MDQKHGQSRSDARIGLVKRRISDAKSNEATEQKQPEAVPAESNPTGVGPQSEKKRREQEAPEVSLNAAEHPRALARACGRDGKENRG